MNKQEKIIASTETPEKVMLELDDDKKANLIEKLNLLKEQISAFDNKLSEKKQQFSLIELLPYIIEINKQVRDNLILSKNLTEINQEQLSAIICSNLTSELELLNQIEKFYLAIIPK